MTEVVEKKLILTKFFDPKFIGEGWKIIEEDPRSLALPKEIEVNKFLFKSYLQEGENRITGEEKILRLKKDSGFIPFGANVFLGLWEDYRANKESSVLEWLFLNKEVKFMDFFGTVLRSPYGRRYVLCLYRRDDGNWRWGDYWLDRSWSAVNPSVGCAS